MLDTADTLPMDVDMYTTTQESEVLASQGPIMIDDDPSDGHIEQSAAFQETLVSRNIHKLYRFHIFGFENPERFKGC